MVRRRGNVVGQREVRMKRTLPYVTGIGIAASALGLYNVHAESEGEDKQGKFLNIHLSSDELERMVASWERQRSMENAGAALVGGALIAADVALVSGTGLFGVFFAGLACVGYVYHRLSPVDDGSNGYGRLRFIDVPPELTFWMGTAQHVRLQAEETFVDEEEHKDKLQLLQTVGSMVASVSQVDLPAGREWQFYCLDKDDVNAFVLPGGYVYVCRGLFDVASSAEEMAVILSHEIAHVKARHVDEQLSITRFPSILKMCYRIFKVCDVITSGTFSLAEEMIGQAMFYVSLSSSILFELPFSRLHESEADAMGCRMLVKLCIHPNTAVAVWEKMAKKENDIGGVAGDVKALFSTHPSSESRVQQMHETSKLLDAEFDARCHSVREDFQATVKKTMGEIHESYIV